LFFFSKDLPVSCGQWKYLQFTINVTQNCIVNQLLREAIQLGPQQVMTYLKKRLLEVNPHALDESHERDSIPINSNTPAAILDAEAASLLEEMLADDSGVLPQLKGFRASVIASDFRKGQSPSNSSYSLDNIQRLKELVEVPEEEEDDDEEQQEHPSGEPKSDPGTADYVHLLAVD